MPIILSQISILISNTNYYQEIQFVRILIGHTNQNRDYQSDKIHIKNTTPISEYQSLSRTPIPIGNINSPESLTGIPILIRNNNPYMYQLYGNIIFQQITFGTHRSSEEGSERKLHVPASGIPIRLNTYRENKSFVIPILKGNTNSPREY